MPPPSMHTPVPAEAPTPKRPPLGVPLWGWLALVAVLAVGAVGAVVLTGDDSTDSVASATTVASLNSTAASDVSITEPESEATTPTTEAPPVSDPPATDAPATEPPSGGEVAGAPAGIAGDRDKPVPLGALADIGAGWRLQVLDVVPDGAAAVAAENEFNDPPPPGSTFTLVTVALGYFGLQDPTSAFQPTISAVGASNLEVGSDCGQVPNQLDSFVDIFAGGMVVGNICFVTTGLDSTSLQLYAVGDFFDGDKVFLQANGPAVGVVPMVGLSGPQAGAASTPARVAPAALNAEVDLGAGWTMAVTGAARDITDSIMTENQFNEPPPDGFRFIGLDVQYSYSGSEAAAAYQVSAKAIGESNVQLGGSCGFFSGEVDTVSDVFAGGTVAGTICFVVPSASPTIVVYASADFESPLRMFAVS